ncbi:MAG: PilZ domain-containing protein [Pseudomonadota bacterium]
MRQFIRHPVDVPVEVGTPSADTPSALHTHDISEGGLALRSERPIALGAQVAIRITYVQPEFFAQARVAWCHPREDVGFEVGVTFLDAEDAFRARMVEQVCHIEDYRQSVHRLEGRCLSAEEAASEWIAQFAEDFPRIGPDRFH